MTTIQLVGEPRRFTEAELAERDLPFLQKLAEAHRQYLAAIDAEVAAMQKRQNSQKREFELVRWHIWCRKESAKP